MLFPDLDPPMLQNDPLRFPPFHLDADLDIAFHFDADADPNLDLETAFHCDANADLNTDPVSQNDADSDPDSQHWICDFLIAF